jgi:hypothetical protein
MQSPEAPAQGAVFVPYDPKLPPDGQWNNIILDPRADWPVCGPHVPPSYWLPYGQIPFAFFPGPMGQPRAFSGPPNPFHPPPPPPHTLPPSHVLPASNVCIPQPFPAFFRGGNPPSLPPIPNTGTYSSLPSPVQYSYGPSINPPLPPPPMLAEKYPPVRRVCLRLSHPMTFRKLTVAI